MNSARPALFREKCRRLVEPMTTGLPNWRVVVWFPALVTVGALVLISLHISGTSSGAHWLSFGSGVDPRAILGGPRLIRTDEWLVNQGWIVGQFRQGFPAVNWTFPGGMDATVLMELPTWDWSAFFRPHSWGYLFFGLDAGVAWAWWIPAIGMVSGAYLLVVTLLPRRPLTSAIVACAVFFSPIFQWWYGPNAIWPAAWSLLAMAAVLWVIRDPRLWVRIVWSVLIGWLAVTTAIGLYVPFIVPCVVVFLTFSIGAVIASSTGPDRLGRSMIPRLMPLIAAAIAAGATVLVWVRTRSDTIASIQATVYPGARSDPTGQILQQDPFLLGLAGAPFGQSFLSADGPSLLGPNPSEAATAILLGIYLLPGLVWLVIRRYRQENRIDWLSVGALAGLGIVLAFLFIPGWDAVARLLLLDKVPVSRFRIGFAVMVPLFYALVVRHIDARPAQRYRSIAAVSGAFTLLTIVVGAVVLADRDPVVFESIAIWPVVAVAIVATVVLVFLPKGATVAAGALLVASLGIGAAVNPLYRGLFDLNQTDVGQKIASVEAASSGTWVGVGTFNTMALVMESGVRGYSGVQTYPPVEMWNAIDPERKYEDVWNRLAHVRWVFGAGEPSWTFPQADQILGTLDPCSSFAQRNVDYIVADERPDTTDCLVELFDVSQGTTDMQIYRIVPPGEN